MLSTLLGTGGVVTPCRAVPMLPSIRMLSLALSTMLPRRSVSSTPPAMFFASSRATITTPRRLLCVPPLTVSWSAAQTTFSTVSSPPALRFRSAPLPVACTRPLIVALPLVATRTWLPALAVEISLPRATCRPKPLLSCPVTTVKLPEACSSALAVTSSPLPTSTRCPPMKRLRSRRTSSKAPAPVTVPCASRPARAEPPISTLPARTRRVLPAPVV